MGYYIKFEDMWQAAGAAARLTSEGRAALKGVLASIAAIEDAQGFSGQAAKSAKGYFHDVHGNLIVGLDTVLREYLQQLQIYRDGFLQVDTANDAAFREDCLHDIDIEYRNQANDFEDLTTEFRAVVATVDDVVTDFGPNNAGDVLEGFAGARREARETKDDVGEYEQRHVNDLAQVRAMLTQLNALIEQFPSTGGPVTSWMGPSSFLASPAFAAMQGLVTQMTASQNDRQGLMSEIDQRDAGRIQRMQADARQVEGEQQIISAIVAFFGSLLVIGTMGYGVPVWAALTLSLSGTAFAASDTYEGLDNIRLGQLGDATTTAVNPLAQPILAVGFTMEDYRNLESFVYTLQATAGLVGPARSLAQAGRNLAPVDQSKLLLRNGTLGIDGIEFETLTNAQTRAWYIAKDELIPSRIDRTLPLEIQARQASALRNIYRSDARRLMRDRAEAARLNREHPNLTWETVVTKYRRQGLSGDDLWRAIIDASQRPNPSVSKRWGLE